jgi:hypothetical protein
LSQLHHRDCTHFSSSSCCDFISHPTWPFLPKPHENNWFFVFLFFLNLSFLLVSNPSFVWMMIQGSQNTFVHVDCYAHQNFFFFFLNLSFLLVGNPKFFCGRWFKYHKIQLLMWIIIPTKTWRPIIVIRILLAHLQWANLGNSYVFVWANLQTH